MKDMKVLRLILFVIVLYLALISIDPLLAINNEPIVESSINHQNDYVSDITKYIKSNDYSYSQRNINFFDEGHFFVRRIDFNSSNGYHDTSYLIPGNSGTIKYFRDKKLVTADLKEGNLPLNTILFIETDKHNAILSQAYSYKDLGSATKDALVDEYPVRVTKQDKYYKVTYSFNNRKDHHGIIWGAFSDNKLVDFTNDVQLSIWSNYDLDRMARLGEDGYYYRSPDSYKPSTKTSYLRNPSMYIVSSWIKTGDSVAADILGKSYLLIGLDNINEDGFIPTLPESNWLKKDYNIGAGFFDTRFNADMGYTYLEAYKIYGLPEFKEGYKRIASYYTMHVLKNHRILNDSLGNPGWLVEDYASNDDNRDILPVHTSLNHQIFAADWFLKMFELEGNKLYEDIALKMLKGVKITTPSWIMDDNNLEYAYMSNGTYGLIDYPYLTYNDLFNFQKTYFRLYQHRDPDIDTLMRAKKIWMDNNGITNYHK